MLLVQILGRGGRFLGRFLRHRLIAHQSQYVDRSEAVSVLDGGVAKQLEHFANFFEQASDHRVKLITFRLHDLACVEAEQSFGLDSRGSEFEPAERHNDSG